MKSRSRIETLTDVTCQQVEDVDDDDLLEDVMEEDDEGEEDGEDSVVDEDC